MLHDTGLLGKRETPRQVVSNMTVERQGCGCVWRFLRI